MAKKKPFPVLWTGTIGKITFENNKIIKFKLLDMDKSSKTYVTICCFYPNLFDEIKCNEGHECKLIANMAECNYLDRNGNWQNTYTVALDDIKIVNSNTPHQIESDELQF